MNRRTKSVLFTLIAITASLALAAETFEKGQLVVDASVGALVVKDKNGRDVSLLSGPAEIKVSGKGFWGKGYIEIKAANDKVLIEIPRSAYGAWTVSDKTIKAYASETGQKYNIFGAKETVIHADLGRDKVMRSCSYTGVRMGNVMVCRDGQILRGRSEGDLLVCHGQRLIEVQRQLLKQVYSVNFIDPTKQDMVVATASVEQAPYPTEREILEIQSCR